MTAGRDAFMAEWERRGYPKFTPIPPLFREEDDGRGNLTLKRAEMSRGFLRVAQIAEWAGVSPQAIHQRENAGEFDCGPFEVQRIGSAIRIPVETFWQWAEKHKRGGMKSDSETRKGKRRGIGLE